MKRIVLVCLVFSQFAVSQDIEAIKKDAGLYSTQIKQLIFDISDSIWALSEASFQDFKTSEMLKNVLEKEGFSIQEKIDGYPTMFTASFGNRGPLIGILAEADADSPLEQIRVFGLPIAQYGHGAGHHLLGAGSLGAALVLKKLIQERKIECRVGFYFSTAEGSLGGRVPMVRRGLFDKVDLSFFWHPAPVTTASISSWDAIIDMEVNYHGTDALKNSLNLMDSIQTIKDTAGPNLILRTKIRNSSFDLAIPNDSLKLLVRIEHLKQESAVDIYNRLKNTLELQQNQNFVDWKVFRAVHEFIPNLEGNTLAYQNILRLDKRTISNSDLERADKIYSFTEKEEGSFLSSPLPFRTKAPDKLYGYGSDIGDVSWKTPLISFVISTLPRGLSMRNWEGAAFMNSEYSKNAIKDAIDVITFTSIDYLMDPGVRARIKSEFDARLEGRSYSEQIEIRDTQLSRSKRSY